MNRSAPAGPCVRCWHITDAPECIPAGPFGTAIFIHLKSMNSLAKASRKSAPDSVSPNRRRVGLLLLLPLIFAVLFSAAYPAAYLALTSISKSTMGKPFISWVGLNNFVSALQGDFAWSLMRTALFAIPTSLVQLILGVAIAVLLNSKMRFRSLGRTLLLLPLMSPPVMVGIAWKVMLHPTGGFVSRTLAQFAWLHTPSSFLGEMPWAILSIAAADTWQWTPFIVILVYATLQTLPAEFEEAARIDGAGYPRILFAVQLPLLAPALIAIYLLKLILSFKTFDLVYVLTSGGPGVETSLSSYKIWQTLFQDFNLGMASAQTLLLCLIVTLITLPVTWWHRRIQRTASL
jgi:multiple sugar transport system permease protein